MPVHGQQKSVFFEVRIVKMEFFGIFEELVDIFIENTESLKIILN